MQTKMKVTLKKPVKFNITLKKKAKVNPRAKYA